MSTSAAERTGGCGPVKERALAIARGYDDPVRQAQRSPRVPPGVHHAVAARERIELLDAVCALLQCAPGTLDRELRLAAAVQWYQQGRISHSRSNHLQLLRAFADEFWVPEPVANEVLRRGMRDVSARAIRDTEWLTVQPAAAFPATIAAWRLGAVLLDADHRAAHHPRVGDAGGYPQNHDHLQQSLLPGAARWESLTDAAQGGTFQP